MSDKQLLQKNETLKRQYRELLALKKKMKGRLVQRMIENCEDQMLEIWYKLGV